MPVSGADHMELPRALLQKTHLFLPLILASLLILSIFHLPGYFWQNLGLVMLNHALAQPQNGSGSQAIVRAERLLDRATSYDKANRPAWRGLALSRAAQDKGDEAIAAWREAGISREELTRWGDLARGRQEYQLALKWYEWGVRLQPNVGDAWHDIALVYEGMEEWRKALSAYERALSLPLETLELGDIHYRIGRLLFHKMNPPAPAQALVAFEAAITENRFSEQSLELQTHYQRGEVLRRLGRLSEALSEFEWVIARQPTHYSALVSLGAVSWQVEHDFPGAVAALNTAMSLEPDTKWAYRALAQVYEQSGRRAEAIATYRRVLNVDPEDELALRRMTRLSINSQH